MPVHGALVVEILHALEDHGPAAASWFNHRRLLGSIGNISPAEAQARYHETCRDTTMAA